MDCAIVCLPNSRANGGKVATGPPGGAAPRGASVPRPPTLVLSKQRGRVDMDVLARFALPGIVALSAIGALIAAVLLVRYGVVVEEDIDDAEQRVGAMRIAHALIAFCFAGVAVLAVAALVARPASSTTSATASAQRAETPAPSADASGPAEVGTKPAESAPGTASGEAPAPAQSTANDRPPARGERDADVRRVEEQFRAEIETLKRRLDAAVRERDTERPNAANAAIERQDTSTRPDASETRALPPRRDGRLESSAKATPTRSEPQAKAEPPRRPAAGAPAALTPPADDVATLPALVGAPQVRTSIQGIRVDVHRQAGSGRDTIYSIRLVGSGDRPLTGADVTLLAYSADGGAVSAPLMQAGEPGLYRARLAEQPSGDLRLRVVHAQARFEVSLDRAASW